MTSTRIVLIALAMVALAAPVASARQARTDHFVVRKIPERHAPWRIATTANDTSALDYVIPGVMLIAMLGAGVAYATSRPARGRLPDTRRPVAWKR